jgi:zinc protease
MRRFAKPALAAIVIAVTTALFAPRADALAIKRMTLKDGAVLLVSEQHQLPMLTMAIAFDAGSRRDPKGKEGLAALTASCLTLGTRKLTAAQFDQKVDFMGSSVAVSAGRDYSTAYLTSLTKYEDQTIRLLAEALTEPALRDQDIERKRAERVAAIKADEEDPGYTAAVAFTKTLFGDTPYGHPADGYPDTVAKLTPDDVRNFYRAHYRTKGAIIAVAGDVKAEAIEAKLEKALAGLAGSAPSETVPAAPEVKPGLHLTVIDRNVAQANIVLGFGGIARSNPDFYRLQVMNYILGGGGFASRMMRVVRSKAGLAYSVGSYFDTGLFPGSFETVLQTKNRSANEAIRLVLQQLAEIRQKPVSDTELASAKKFLVGSFPLKFDRLGSIAGFMLQVQYYGLGLDYADRYPKLIDAVTPKDVLHVARKYLHPGAIDVVVVANEHEAGVKTASLKPE